MLALLVNLVACSDTSDISQSSGASPGSGSGTPSVAATTPGPSVSPTAPAEDAPFQAEIAVDTEPGYITTGAGSVWVGNHVAGTVSRIDPETNRESKRIAVEGEPTGMLFAFGDVWTFAALAGELNRIDVGTEAVVARVRLTGTGGGINGLAVGAGHVWVAENSGFVYAVDPATNRVAKRTRVLPECGPGGNLAFVAQAVWYACWDQPFLWRLDPASGAVVAKIRVGPMAGSPADGGDVVWVPLMSEGVVVAVDPGTNKPRTRVRVGDRVEQVRVQGGDMWARVSDTKLAHVSLKRRKVTQTYELPAAPVPGGGLAIGFGSVWVANFGESTVWRLGD